MVLASLKFYRCFYQLEMGRWLPGSTLEGSKTRLVTRMVLWLQKSIATNYNSYHRRTYGTSSNAYTPAGYSILHHLLIFKCLKSNISQRSIYIRARNKLLSIVSKLEKNISVSLIYTSCCSKTCVNRPLKKRQNNGLNDN